MSTARLMTMAAAAGKKNPLFLAACNFQAGGYGKVFEISESPPVEVFTTGPTSYVSFGPNIFSHGTTLRSVNNGAFSFLAGVPATLGGGRAIVSVSGDGQYVAAGSTSGTSPFVEVFELNGSSLTLLFNATNGSALDISWGGGSDFLTVSGSNRVEVFQKIGGVFSSLTVLSSSGTAVRSRMSPSGNVVAFAAQNGSAQVFVKSGTSFSSASLSRNDLTRGFSVAMSGDAERLIFGVSPIDGPPAAHYVFNRTSTFGFTNVFNSSSETGNPRAASASLGVDSPFPFYAYALNNGVRVRNSTNGAVHSISLPSDPNETAFSLDFFES